MKEVEALQNWISRQEESCQSSCLWVCCPSLRQVDSFLLIIYRFRHLNNVWACHVSIVGGKQLHKDVVWVTSITCTLCFNITGWLTSLYKIAVMFQLHLWVGQTTFSVGLMLDQHWHFATWIGTGRQAVSTVQLQCLKWRAKGSMEKKTVLHSIFPLLLGFHHGPFESLLNHPSLFHEWMDQSQKIKTAITAHTETHP